MLEVSWQDGGRSRLSGRTLRWACPCAECRGELGSPGRLDAAPELSEAELQVTDVKLVGQYALQIAFGSGHNTGIYTFRRLRDL